MARCGCSGASCFCVLSAGDDILVTGAGTAGSPWVVSSEFALTCPERLAIYNALITLGMAATPAHNLSGWQTGDC